MNSKLKSVAIMVMAASLVGPQAYAGDPPAPAQKKAAAKKPPKPTVEEQIEALRQQLQTQIDSLKSDLATKDAQLKQAQQAAADAQAAASKAQADASAQQQANTENAAAVSTLQASVTDMKSANAAAVSSLSDDATAIKKSIASPMPCSTTRASRLTPGGFLAAETVWRQRQRAAIFQPPSMRPATNTQTLIHLSEFYGSARQSRVSLMV